MRKPFVGGNWKMNTNLATGTAIVRRLSDHLGSARPAEVVVYPPYPYLLNLSGVLSTVATGLRLGAQDVCDRPNGAMTGEVSAEMLLECNVYSVLVGHSERRHIIGESDALINAKAKHGLETGLQVVLCIGETLEQREADETDSINENQLRAGLKSVTASSMANVVIAYEPVWAIGTGRSATAQDAQKAHAHIRAVITSMFDASIADSTRIIYGGSVNSTNAGELFACPDIDGGLIGGASLDPEEFAKIVRASEQK